MKAATTVALLCVCGLANAQSGGELIGESLRRHVQPEHAYEEQALVMTDRHGHHSVRTVRCYQRRTQGYSDSLWVIETPAELRGTSIASSRPAGDEARVGATPARSLFGSTFLLADLEDEQPHDFRYERDEDQVLDRVPHFVLRAWPASAAVARATGFHERRIYLRKDNLFVSRIDFKDASGRPLRRQTFRDPRPDAFGAWRAGMVLMEDLRDHRRSLLKIERRVHSPDYVPSTVFAGLRQPP